MYRHKLLARVKLGLVLSERVAVPQTQPGIQTPTPLNVPSYQPDSGRWRQPQPSQPWKVLLPGEIMVLGSV